MVSPKLSFGAALLSVAAASGFFSVVLGAATFLVPPVGALKSTPPPRAAHRAVRAAAVALDQP
jgi:hypothetical protein